MNQPSTRWRGIVAATLTPFDERGALDLDKLPALIERSIRQGVAGLYVCGSTGEGPSMTGDERRAVTEATLAAVQGRVPVMVQVGHNSLTEARELARHAAREGADAISATCPSYFPIAGVDTLIDCMAAITEGCELPFFYYHIPSLTGASASMVDFLRRGAARIPTLRGLKYTQTTVHEYQRCLELDDGAFEILWGCDEMMLSALSVGAPAVVGSTYNLALPLYQRLWAAFRDGDLARARLEQGRSARLVEVLCRFPFHSALKEAMRLLGADAGSCRLPFPRLDDGQRAALERGLAEIDFLDFAGDRSPS